MTGGLAPARFWRFWPLAAEALGLLASLGTPFRVLDAALLEGAGMCGLWPLTPGGTSGRDKVGREVHPIWLSKSETRTPLAWLLTRLEKQGKQTLGLEQTWDMGHGLIVSV